jgi:S1-C subfamily serine protease
MSASLSLPAFALAGACLSSSALPPPAFSEPAEKSITQVVEEQGKAVLVISNLGFGDSQQGVGSGFIIRPDGVVLTNYHVIEHAQAVTVKLPDGREFRAQGVLGSDPELDVAVLKIEATGLPTISLGDSDQVKVGQRVIAIGNPLGMFEYTVSDGIISAIRLDDAPEAKMKKLLQITAPISQGSSGGPLLDLTGKVIGITAAISMQGQNLNFAIPINVAKPLIKDGPVLAFSEVKPGALLPGFSDCPVIGNIKSRIYHVPGGQYYAQLQFSESAICFKSEEDATKHGYRRSMR